jgi:acyl carrier protein
MSGETNGVKLDRETIFRDMVQILENMTSDWDTSHEGEIRPETRLIADLGFESIDVVQLVVDIEERYQRRDLPFEKLLMENDRYVDELQVGKAVDFLVTHLNQR